MKVVLGIALGLILAAVQPNMPSVIKEYIHDVAGYIESQTEPKEAIETWGK